MFGPSCILWNCIASRAFFLMAREASSQLKKIPSTLQYLSDSRPPSCQLDGIRASCACIRGVRSRIQFQPSLIVALFFFFFAANAHTKTWRFRKVPPALVGPPTALDSHFRRTSKRA
ncbi:hypothetical protein TRVL_06045 [Trypanosoma vivax]|nr:hypothetical protein TRVL_06045 [Trypanosoma vivax]